MLWIDSYILSNPAPPLDPAIVAFFKGENNANDETGVYNATAGGNITYSAGKVGNAFVHDTSPTGIVTVPSINVGTTFSVDFYFYLTGWASGTSRVLFGNDWTSAAGLGTLYVGGSGTGGRLTYYRNSAITAVSGDNIIQLNHWYKVTLVYSSSKIKIYLNGCLYAIESSTHSETYNGPLVFGGSVTADTDGIAGLIDEFTIWNTDKTPATGIRGHFKGDNDYTDFIGLWPAGSGGVGAAFGTGSGGAANTAFLFNGNNNSQVTFKPIRLGIDYTVEFDVYVDASGNTGYRDIFGYNYFTAGVLGALYLNAGKLEYWEGNSKRCQGVATIPTTTWTHIKMTYSQSDSKSRLYINGSLDVAESGTHTETWGTEPFYAGYFNSDNTLAGRVDDIKVYNAVV